jgi:type IV secretory pathway TraG/TraD family ATPase VirD4
MSNQIAEEGITFFATTDYRHRETQFGIKHIDRRAHMYILGKTGTGKSTLLETLIQQDLLRGHGLALLDPHGDLVEKVLSEVPQERRADLIYFDVTDAERSLGFNPLESVSPRYQPLAASGLLSVFQHIWSDSWGPRLEHILRNALLALLEQPAATLADIPRMLDDNAFRKQATSRVTNEQVRNFWLKEYAGYPARFRAEAIAPLQNKVGAFLANPLIHRIVMQEHSAFRMRKVMDEGKVLLVNLAKGKIGADTSTLLGALLVSRLGLAALSRADRIEDVRRDFYLYLDEFHNFTTLSLVGMLSELRKYRLNLILAHQYLAQLDERLLAAILGNVGTILSFRIGPSDAETIAREFAPEFSPTDLLNLPNYHIYLKLMIDGRVSSPFSAETLPPLLNLSKTHSP